MTGKRPEPVETEEAEKVLRLASETSHMLQGIEDVITKSVAGAEKVFGGATLEDTRVTDVDMNETVSPDGMDIAWGNILDMHDNQQLDCIAMRA